MSKEYEMLDAKGKLQMAKNGLAEIEQKHWVLVMNGRLETNPVVVKNLLQQQADLKAKMATMKTIIQECEEAVALETVEEKA